MNGTDNIPNNVLSKVIQFSWIDYCLFTVMLGGSVLIGVYFGCFGKRQTTAKEYLLGGRNMTVFPIAMSLIASHISGITLLAMPSDVYKHGSTISVMNIGIILVCIFTAYVSIPVFYELQLTSTYEYLKMRFNSKIRTMASLLYIINIILILPVVIYAPSLAFTQASPVSLHIVNPIICTMCIFYTTIGGLKAVVWTDALQFSAMLGAMLAVLYLGVFTVGGFSTVFTRAAEGERLDIDFDVVPTKRDTFFALLVGWTINWIPQVAFTQGSVQKFLALPTLSHIRKSIAIFAVGIIFSKVASIFTGLIIYAKYHDCDPFTDNKIQKDDQLLPYYVMDVAKHIPGLPGLFIAGVFCAGLSTLSAHMNSLSGIIYEDLLSSYMPKDISQEQISNILKLIVVIIGVVSTALTFVVEHLGGLFALVISLSGISLGPTLGLFILGMLVPSANSKGALAGSITSLISMAIIVIGNQIYKTKGLIIYPMKPLSIAGCLSNTTLVATSTQTFEKGGDVFALFRITHYYYALVGALIVFAVALPVSWLTENEKPVDEKLITPFMRRWISKRKTQVFIDVIRESELVRLNGKR
ncbi:Sodium:solute symporter family [Popillia japonica]|uniref:Sodium:solute symporter family n=1 Tax=Popillia japonica TaxID=7064 RepID=A0AAW1IFK4_POPJA